MRRSVNSAIKSQAASHARRTKSITIRRRKLDQSQELSELWERYRPLQPYLDSISTQSAAQLIHSSRMTVLEVLSERYPTIDMSLDGDVIMPLGLKLV